METSIGGSTLESVVVGLCSVQLRWKVGRAGRALTVLAENKVEAEGLGVSLVGGDDGVGGGGSDFSGSRGIGLALGVSCEADMASSASS